MNKILLSGALVSAMALSSAAMADEMMVKEIEVQTEIEAIQNAEAATVWHDISADLEAAILARVVDRMDESGAIVMVDIDEVSLANNFELATGLENATLRGWVKIERTYKEKEQPVEAPEELYELTVSAQQAQVYYPEGTDLSVLEVSSEVFYQAMLAAFADNVVSKLQ
ncbi:hypothetical protein LZG00_10530 [Rhodobacteraceae bacterium LMO-12]|nr:hypothetical protein [Rhodobacteraceae bacterium LMO-JJ12]